MRKILKSKKNIMLMIYVTSVIVGGCGLSEENLAKLTESRNQLAAEKTAVEEEYGMLTSDALEAEILGLSQKYSEFEQLDFEKVKDKEVEQFISDMDVLAKSYTDLKSKLDKELQNETEAAAEEAKHKEVQCWIKNQTGSELTSITFADKSQNTETDNYILDGTTLPTGRIISGITLPIYEDSTQRTIKVTDTLGNETEYELTVPDMAAAIENGISIVLNSPENGIAIGKYVVEKGAVSGN